MKALLFLSGAFVLLVDALIEFVLQGLPAVQSILMFGLVAVCVYLATDDGKTSQDDV